MRSPVNDGGLWRATVRCGAAAVLWCFLASVPVGAQIELGASLEFPAYLTGEAFAARVLIENHLDTPMVLGDDYHNAELFVELVRDRSGGPPETERRPVRREWVMMPGQKSMDLVEITSLFDLRQPGGYRLRAIIRYEGNLFLSHPVGFDLVSGVELLSARRALPGYFEIELEYSLRYWKRGKSEHAFLVIRDVKTDSIHGTFVLGPVVRVNPPAIEFDGQGQAVVVHQSGRNRYTRSVFSADRNGASLVEQTHHLEDGKPYPQKKMRP